MKPPLLGYEPLSESDSIDEFIDFVEQGENVGSPIFHYYLVVMGKTGLVWRKNYAKVTGEGCPDFGSCGLKI